MRRADTIGAVETALTELLGQWRGGDAAARDRVVAAIYPQLRAVAARQLDGERRGHTLQPTALVNEAWLKLSGMGDPDCRDRVHFVHLAARLMREILIDHARRRAAAKRDGGERVTLTAVDAQPLAAGVDPLALGDALEALERLDAVKARVVDLRYFGGLTIDETALALEMSPATVKRHWQAARLWLFDALREQAGRASAQCSMPRTR